MEPQHAINPAATNPAYLQTAEWSERAIRSSQTTKKPSVHVTSIKPGALSKNGCERSTDHVSGTNIFAAQEGELQHAAQVRQHAARRRSVVESHALSEVDCLEHNLSQRRMEREKKAQSWKLHCSEVFDAVDKAKDNIRNQNAVESRVAGVCAQSNWRKAALKSIAVVRFKKASKQAPE
jgi:hypothetical protein